MWFNKKHLKEEAVEKIDHPHLGHPVHPDKPILKLDESTALVYTRWGGYMTVPTSNLDVAIGVVRDRIIEPWTTQLVYQTLNTSDVYVNIGANFGYYSVLGAHKVERNGKVFAIEANPYMFLYLMKTVYWSGYPDVIRAFNFAAFSETDQEISFFFDPQYAGGGSLLHEPHAVDKLENCFWNTNNIEHLVDNKNREWVHGTRDEKKLYTSIKSKTKKIDDMITTFGKVDLLHMDVEGAEVEVILGAKKLIKDNTQIKIIMEWDAHAHNKSNNTHARAEEMWNFLFDEMKYEVFRVKPETYGALGTYPDLEPVNKLTVWNIPHSDLLLTPS